MIVSESYAQVREEWLKKHAKADRIWFDMRTKEPVKAVYSTLNGKPRKFVAEYPFPPEWFTEYDI